MKTPTHRQAAAPLQVAVLAFLALAGISLCVVYLIDPAIKAGSVGLTPTPANPYPLLATLSVLGVLAMVVLLMVGVLRRWRWVFWLMLVAFSASILELPDGPVAIHRGYPLG